MNAKKTESKKTVTVAIDGDAQRALAKASRAVSELASASIECNHDGRRTKRS